MNAFDKLGLLAARALMAALFIPAGYGKIGGFQGTVGYIASKGLPLPEVGAAAAIAVELLGGLALLAGWQTRWVALLLAVFTAAAGFFFHNYWAMPADQQGMQSIMFWKNVAIVGGLLAIAVAGPGGWSVDGSRRR